MTAMDAKPVYDALEAYFKPAECTDVFSTVGLCADNTDRIRSVYTATFAGEEVFAWLRAQGASDCLLFTHHPVPQRENPEDRPPAIPEAQLRFMEQNRISLFSYHIPLDRNGEYSPGTNLARAIGARVTGEFYEQNRVKMGVLCEIDCAAARQVSARLETVVGHAAKLYPHGGEALQSNRIAIMAGGAKSTAIYEELRAGGINLFITGVTNPRVPWVGEIHKAAARSGVSLLGGTHCSTEKFALMAMNRFFERLGLPAFFIPEAPHLQEL